MIYTPMTKKAINLMFELQKNQKDKSGLPYVFHPFHLAEQMIDEDSTIVALLHDVVEDTSITFKDLEEIGFSRKVIEALKLLTHKEGMDYMAYVKEIAKNPIAKRVKKVDLEHNMSLERLDNITEEDLLRLSKYKKAYNILTQDQQIDIEKSAIIGFAVGDALGVPVEFLDRKYFDYNPVKEMLEYGTHNVPKGTWSDDTSLLIATLDSITNNSGIDYYDIMQKFSEWYRKGKYTATDKVFDIGISTKNAITNYESGKEPLECGMKGFYENGNGSLMRILPGVFYSIYNKFSFLEEKIVIDNLSSLTHAHEISKLGCKIYSDYIKLLINGIDKNMALNKLPLSEYKKYYNESSINIYSRILNGKLRNLDRDSIKSSGFIGDTLEAAIWSLLKTDSYEDAVLLAVNLGEDTDTIGAVTGSLAGVLYGFDNIPKKWINDLKKEKYLENIVYNFKKNILEANIERKFK